NPDLAKRLRQMLHDNPDAGQHLLGRLGPHIREVIAEPDPETRELRLALLKNGWATLGTVKELREAVKGGDAAKREQATGQLRPLLGEHYDLQIKLNQREITMLEQRLNKLRQDVAEQGGPGKRDEFINKRLEQMSREHGPDGPGGPGSAAGG